MGNRRRPKSLKREDIVNIPTDEKVLLKIVPAKANGEIVGDTYLYDDGTVEIVFTNKEAELHTRQQVQAELNQMNREAGTHYKASDLGLDI